MIAQRKALANRPAIGHSRGSAHFREQERSRCLAFEQPSPLVAAYFSKREAVLRFLVARLGDRQEAEDLVQELFLKLEGVQTPPDLRDPVSYLFRMALNLARDKRRERQRAKAREGDWADTRTLTSGDELIADAPTAESAYAAKQRIAAIRGALEELSPQCRRIFLMHKFEDMSHEEVAHRVGISRSTVEKHMHTALKHLIARLGRD
jgi:RNA polymerase sigma-70 factor (ECF subfamily)